MNTGGALAVLVLLGLGWASVVTVLVTVRGGRGPADPPASHPHVDPAGFPVLPAPRGALHGRRTHPARRRRRPAARQRAARPEPAGALRGAAGR